jgi:hypothetical protein
VHTMITCADQASRHSNYNLLRRNQIRHLAKLSFEGLASTRQSTMGYVASSYQSRPRASLGPAQPRRWPSPTSGMKAIQDHADTRSNTTLKGDPSSGAQLGGE